MNDYIKEIDELIEALKCSNTPEGRAGKDCFECKYHIEKEVGKEYGEKHGCRQGVKRRYRAGKSEGVYFQTGKSEIVYVDTDCDMKKMHEEAIAKLGALKVHVQADVSLMETEELTPKRAYLEGYKDAVKEIHNITAMQFVQIAR